MPTICSKCRRTNPADAAFCYYDGNLLNAHAGKGPVAAGRQAFVHPFVFPSGRICHNFDELALACQERWDEARSLLQQGCLEKFFAGLGRTDLARAARAAARAPDGDRGLDDLLEKVPGSTLQRPRLVVQPQDVNLGVIPVGSDRRFDLHLENGGMRLLYGTVTAEDTPWLVLGDGAGSPEKLFQFGVETRIPVQVKGKRLRAGVKPLEGKLVVESNGGTATVTVRVEVPPKPFPEGVLAGAITPRQVAERAKEHPKEAAALFEKGVVAQWYRDNGWTYPVQGPLASGVGGIQQFFEALGLTAPPKVEVSARSISLTGMPGERLEYVLEVSTQEKRPVWAYAGSTQPWLRVGKPNLQGRVATIPLTVTSVPDRPGDKLQAQVNVTANGNQRFAVGVTLTVTNRPAAARSVPAQEAKPVAIPVSATAGPPPVAPIVRPQPREPSHRPATVTAVPVGRVPWWTHLVPVGLLLLALGGLFVVDLVRKPKMSAGVAVEEPIDPDPVIAVRFHDREVDVVLGTDGVKPEDGRGDPEQTPATWEPSMRFGLVMLKEVDPHNPDRRKRLTYEEQGWTNNTVVRLDGRDWIFGERPFRIKRDDSLVRASEYHGRWKEGARDVWLPAGERKGEGRRSVWVYDPERVEVTQVVEIVPGEQSRKLDTCLVRYVIENKDKRPHHVGLRFLLDTYIGANDGVPFVIPGAAALCDTSRRFERPEEVPDFIQALEREDLSNPGTVAQVQLRVGGRLEPPSRVTLGAWPNVRLGSRDPRCRQEKTLWEVPVFPIKVLKDRHDSAVAIYWDEKLLAPGAKREVGFAYGLGQVTSGEASGRLGLSVGGRFVPGGEFTLTALVDNPLPGETLTLTLPAGFELADDKATQPVPPMPADAVRRTSPVTWKIKAGAAGSHTLKVQSSAGAVQTQRVRIRTSSIFD